MAPSGTPRGYGAFLWLPGKVVLVAKPLPEVAPPLIAPATRCATMRGTTRLDWTGKQVRGLCKEENGTFPVQYRGRVDQNDRPASWIPGLQFVANGP